MRQTLLRPAARQTGFLTGFDGLTNLLDYGFHIYLARVLLPGDFAVVQTLNTAALILLTAFAVLQPVVARYTAEATELDDSADIARAIFQFYAKWSTTVGLGLWLLALLGQQAIAGWLNVPQTAVSLTTFILFLATTRPVIAGLLQGRHQFVAFGTTRLVNALGRLGCALLLVTFLRTGLTGAVVSLPVGGLLALLFGLAAVGRNAWQPAPPLPAKFRHALPLVSTTFLAFIAYMSLLNVDLIWVNRLFAPETAGAYATAVLLRRALSLLPAAVIVVMYPRAVAQMAQGRLPDKLLLQTAVVAMLPTLLFTLVYATLGDLIIRWTFGAAYGGADSLLLTMGMAMLGFSLTAVWLNFYLATHPLPFVVWLLIVAVAQLLLFSQFHSSPTTFATIFALSGWVTALGGLLLYLLWLRPRLKRASFLPNATPDPR
ncbi:MAG: hypothetical protein KDE56_09505 [Anaerolineales bacterium]|nr:hypothetical protein [Anaerolineales bacterium]